MPNPFSLAFALLSLGQYFWLAVTGALLVFVLILGNGTTRAVSTYPAISSFIVAAPYLEHLLLGTELPGPTSHYAMMGLNAAPWVFLLVALIASGIAYLRRGNSIDEKEWDLGNKNHSSFWAQLNVAVSVSILLSTALSPNFNALAFLFRVPVVSQALLAMNYVGIFLMAMLIDYIVVALILVWLLRKMKCSRLVSPSAYGAHILLIANALEVVRITMQGIGWPLTSHLAFGLDQVADLYIWPVWVLVVTGYLTMAISQRISVRSNISINTDAAR